MLFWGLTAIVLFAILGVFFRAIVTRGAQSEAPAAYDLRVYRDQLAEVERDLARGVLDPADAERVRTEISRRILAADAAMAAQSGGGTAPTARSGLLLGALGTALVAGAFGIYLKLGAPGYGDLALEERIAMAEAFRRERPDQATAETGLEAPASLAEENAEYSALVEQLRKALSERPDDLRGYRLLAQAEARLGNLSAAHEAQARVIELTGGQAAELSDLADYADMLILAAGGYVSPEAERVLTLILERDAGNPVARYYWGLMHGQTGRPDTAFRIWDSLLREGPAGAPWIEPIVAQIGEMAARAGVRYQIPQPGSGRGPTSDEIEAAQEMSPSERMEMIEGMVSGLSGRLASEGGPPEDWAQLITALGVLGRMDQAAAIFGEARAVFQDNAGAMDIINRAADRAGLQ